MLKIGLKYYLIMFAKYFLGYFVLIFAVILLIFNGRAMLTQASWSVNQWFSQIKPTAAEPWRPSSALALNPDLTAAVKTVQFAESDTYIVIPKIKVLAPIVFPDTLDNAALLKSLEKGVIKYKDSAQFGNLGTAILLGHSSAYPWYRGKYGSVFALLEKLENNDQFAIVQKNNKVFYYLVNRKQIIVPADFKIDIKDNQSRLVLISCWPVRSNKMRMTVWSDLIKAE
jgi:LPXTG-site transpeptidase (sortase) family protein